MAKFQIYADRNGHYRWRLIAGNGEIVAVSEGYTTRFSALRSVQRVKVLAPVALVV